jgi:hypothetical protein
VSRGERRYFYNQCADLPLAAGDVVVYLVAGPAQKAHMPKG